MSTLRDCLAQYIAARRALGASFYEPGLSLNRFVDRLDEAGAEFITNTLSLQWAMEPVQVERATWGRRLSQVRGFAQWMKPIDARTEVPPANLLSARRRRNPPHIYTDDEIARLMRRAAQLRSPTGLRALTMETLIGLLASTGLRPGEAIQLNRQDVDLSNGILSVRESKLGKSRFVPVHESTLSALIRYAQARDRICRQRLSEAFLLNEFGGRLTAGATRGLFVRISRATGIRATNAEGKAGFGPRLQDFRHAFATGRMLQWYREGRDVTRELPRLSTYLGHVDVGLTYWYIEAVPQLLELAATYLSHPIQPGEQP
ncbi:MAG: tyrosine-type recombinase/integrase [Castellaniella sp.]